MDPLQALLAQARRLRFADPAREERFLRAHLTEGLTRVRWGIGCAVAFTVGIGLLDVLQPLPAADAWFVSHALRFRFGVQLPIWLGLACLAWQRVPRANLDLWVALGVSAVAAWMPAYYGPVNRSAFSILSSDMASMLLFATILLPVRFRSTLVMAITLGVVGPVLTGLFRIGGGYQWVEAVLASIVAYAAIIAIAGWLRERDDRCRFAQQEHLAALNTELTRLHAERGEFMAIAAHDIQAPLNAVKLTAGLALAEPTARGPLRDLLADIAGAATRMGDIVASFLRSHAAERGDLPVRLAPLALAEAAGEALRRHSAAAAAKHQPLSLVPPAALLPPAHADAALVSQVLDNFLTNAIKFTPAGGAITLHTTVGESAATVRLVVRDQGPGLSDTDKARAFAKFARLSAQPTAGEASTGLGLAVARRLAAAMGGTVGVADAPGHGAEFWVELPVAPSVPPAGR
ncbi:MAG: HAMP domain-containing histidine kinase [Verrucomicrobia bacterium]|nr:HAMP domain-containing histidine kinase [Verrucomicrobiota bacterium]